MKAGTDALNSEKIHAEQEELTGKQMEDILVS